MPIVGRLVFHRILSIGNPIGRRARPKVLAGRDLLIRIKPKDLAAAGVERLPRTTGVENGLPQLEDGRRLDVANVVWCTGFHPGFSWIDLPVLGPEEPNHEGGIVGDEPGLYFVGLRFLYSKSSEQIHGVGRDAARIARTIASRHEKAMVSR
jgi:putative flavoprotein involved in K+ transport